VKPFGGLVDWSHPRGAAISLSGFNAGSNNTITVTADSVHPAPDLDWIEIVNTDSSVPSTGLCQPSLWNVTASANGTAAAVAVDGNGTNRWTTNRSMQTGDYYQIDFTGNVRLSTLTLDNTNDGSGNDYPATVAVYPSQDGVNFSPSPLATVAGASAKTVITFTQESLRAVRIQVLSARTSNWWSLGEIETDCSL
jgi:hypothetical protein